MKIQSKLVFDKHSNELIGFVNLGEEELNVSSGSSDLATHALVFFVRGLFGFQRAQGQRSDNPTAAEFGYNDLRIATLRDIAPQSVQGNVSSRHSGSRRKWCDVSDEPLPKKNTSKKKK